MWLRWFAFPALALAGIGVVSLALLGFVILLAYPNLPSIEALTEYQPRIPLRVYTADGLLIGEFGEERRSVVSIEEVPSLMKQAILAMLTGLPKAPSSFNPAINPKRANERQLYVLRRMHELALLDAEKYEEAQKIPISVKRETVTGYEIHAEFVAEMVRQLLYERYPEEVYSRGFRVYTTITRADQEAAYAALRLGLIEYDRRHGYRGPEGFVDLKDAQEEDYEEALQDHLDSDDLLTPRVLEATPKRVSAYRRGGETITVSGEGLKFAERMLDSRTPPTRRIRRGAVIRIQKDEHDDWQIVQLPEAEGAFISVNPQD